VVKIFGCVGVPFFFFKHPLNLPRRDGVRSEFGSVWRGLLQPNARGVLLNASLYGLSCLCCVLLSLWGGASSPMLTLFGNTDAALCPACKGWPQTKHRG
jgi:hypothetical protein